VCRLSQVNDPESGFRASKISVQLRSGVSVKYLPQDGVRIDSRDTRDIEVSGLSHTLPRMWHSPYFHCTVSGRSMMFGCLESIDSRYALEQPTCFVPQHVSNPCLKCACKSSRHVVHTSHGYPIQCAQCIFMCRMQFPCAVCHCVVVIIVCFRGSANDKCCIPVGPQPHPCALIVLCSNPKSLPLCCCTSVSPKGMLE